MLSLSLSSIVSLALALALMVMPLCGTNAFVIPKVAVPAGAGKTSSILQPRGRQSSDRLTLQYIVTSLNEPEPYFHPQQQQQQQRRPFQYQEQGSYRYPSSSSSSSRSASSYAAAAYEQELEARLDQNLSEQAIRQHYQEWCTKFHRRQDSFRFMVFQRNYLSQFKWNLAAGKQVFTLNEYADCTEEEYHQIMKQAAKNVVNNVNVNFEKQLETSVMEVTVVLDEEGDVAKTTTTGSSSVPSDAIDVEIVEHNPYLGY